MSDATEAGAKRRRHSGRGAGWAYRSYTDDDRACALVALHANGGNLRRTAAQLGMPVTTLRKWARDDVRPASPRRVLEAGAALDAKLEAYITKALAISPADFPQASFLEHCQAIALLVDMVVKLREGCRPATARVADGVWAGGRPFDLSRASAADLAALRAWLDRVAPAGAVEGAGGVCPTCGRGRTG